MLEFEGCQFLKQRLLLATLSGKSIRIKKIRDDDESPGLQEFEANLIKLLDEVTNGSRIEINESGTTLFYQPGMLSGGSLAFNCGLQTCISYFLEFLICVAPFTKTPISATLWGITSDELVQLPTVDCIKASMLPAVTTFLGTDEGLELKIINRGAAPKGGGEIHFSCPNRSKLIPIQLTDPGKIKRIRGVAYALRVSPSLANRMVDTAKTLLHNFLPDIYIYTDVCKGNKSGKSPGFGLHLVAETNSSNFYSAFAGSRTMVTGNSELSVPEDVAITATHRLFEEIYRGGCMDSSCQMMATLFMVLGEKDVSKLLVGPLTENTIEFLRDLRTFFQVVFRLQTKDPPTESSGGEKVLMTCVGVGFTNLSKVTL